jgi:hypothetical protein
MLLASLQQQPTLRTRFACSSHGDLFLSFVARCWRLQYTDGEEVTVWLNKVGPYHNPQEVRQWLLLSCPAFSRIACLQTYAYHSLPFCQPTGKTLRHKSDSLVSFAAVDIDPRSSSVCWLVQGVLLEGSDLVDSGLIMHFKGWLCSSPQRPRTLKPRSVQSRNR